MDEWLTVVITTDLKEGFYLKGRLAGERQGACTLLMERLCSGKQSPQILRPRIYFQIQVHSLFMVAKM